MKHERHARTRKLSARGDIWRCLDGTAELRKMQASDEDLWGPWGPWGHGAMGAKLIRHPCGARSSAVDSPLYAK